MSEQQSSIQHIQQLSSALHKRRKERQANGDMEGYILGTQLANEYEDAYSKVTGEYPEKLAEVVQLLAPDWAERVEKYNAEKTELDDPNMLPIDRQVAEFIGLKEYRRIINGG